MASDIVSFVIGFITGLNSGSTLLTYLADFSCNIGHCSIGVWIIILGCIFLLKPVLPWQFLSLKFRIFLVVSY